MADASIGKAHFGYRNMLAHCGPLLVPPAFSTRVGLSSVSAHCGPPGRPSGRLIPSGPRRICGACWVSVGTITVFPCLRSGRLGNGKVSLRCGRSRSQAVKARISSGQRCRQQRAPAGALPMVKRPQGQSESSGAHCGWCGRSRDSVNPCQKKSGRARRPYPSFCVFEEPPVPELQEILERLRVHRRREA